MKAPILLGLLSAFCYGLTACGGDITDPFDIVPEGACVFLDGDCSEDHDSEGDCFDAGGWRWYEGHKC